MKSPVFKVTYLIGGRTVEVTGAENEHFRIDCEITDSAIKGKITSKAKIGLKEVAVRFDHDFKAGDKFFGNGYQAWTTSREYVRSEQMRDITPLAVAQPLKELAGISADNRFVSCPKNPGEFYSHCYTYIKSGEELLFIGSLTERQGFTVIYADMNADTVTVSKDVEGVTLDCAGYDLFDVAILRGGYDEVFDEYFKLMGIGKPRIDHMSGYTSWYNYFQKIDEKIILRDLNALDKVKDSVSIFQVDDGYETYVGDWLDRNMKKFPLGMKRIADEIHAKGYMAGIWLAPFNLQRTSRTYREHPDWVIKDKKGRPLLGVAGWGGAFTMDMYNPEAREYMRHFFDVILNNWGYDMVKLDFLYSQCMFPRNGKSRGTIMCEAMEFLRECCGDKFILGCGVPHGAAFGYVDACRISCDVDLKFAGKFYNAMHINNEIPSAKNAITNAVFRRHLDGRAFCNDPDVFFLRYSNLTFTMEQKLLLAGINHIFGNVLFVSDNAEEYTAGDEKVLTTVFGKSDYKVLSADSDLDGNFTVKLTKDGEQKTLSFNLETGKSNISEILGFPAY